MMSSHILSKYIKREINKHLAAIFVILFLIILGNQFFLVLKESLNLNIIFNDLLNLVFYKSIRDIHLVFVFSIFFAILIALTKLYKNSEIVVMKTSTLSDFSFMKFIFINLLLYFLISLCLLFFISPYAIKQANIIKNAALERPEFLNIIEKDFQEFQNDIVLYVDNVDEGEGAFEQKLQNIFVRSSSLKDDYIILSESGVKFLNKNLSNVSLLLKKGNLYKNIGNIDSTPQITTFESYLVPIYNLNENINIQKESLPESSIISLMQKKEEGYLSEIYTRSMKSIMIIIVSIMAVVLANGNHRAKKNLHYIEALFAVFTYTLLINLVEKNFYSNSDYLFSLMFIIHLFFLIYIYLKYFLKY